MLHPHNVEVFELPPYVLTTFATSSVLSLTDDNDNEQIRIIFSIMETKIQILWVLYLILDINVTTLDGITVILLEYISSIIRIIRS